MLIIALVLAVIGLASLVAAVVTSNELIAWVCIGASVIGVLLLIVDALRDRSHRNADESATGEPDETADEAAEPETAVQDYPDEDIAEASGAPDAAEPSEASDTAEAADVQAADAEPTTELPETTESGAEADADAEHKDAEPKS
ncbi:transmembrane protein [Mycolicibacterium canariasense]|uniref:Transmembrane protein n=1 Tax=Mycolicibacterium canariasense TaxID=228230 RepID=A0A117I8K9_MYCCR|nr:hypothetical protein [Mycolicibacterium canariasense]MCV7212252.1 hypothetical protein [Mycolicibacterium canariasense]ORU97358.1 hypothetical protein AWB94_29835 [Mycolicibacterium canariasense]GAS93350.1 transmembrane protein [Mycolicibacterium canariasense]